MGRGLGGGKYWVSLYEVPGVFMDQCFESVAIGMDFTSTHFCGLMHIWLVGAPYLMITPFSMFHGVWKLDNFTRVKKKYNDM